MKIVIRLFILFLFSVLPAVFAFAETSSIISEGKYVMGDLDTKKDAKSQALIEAKRLAMEKAGTYLESSSEVKNFQLTKDQIKTIAAGIMSVEVLNEDWKMAGESMVLTIKIRAIVDTSNLKDRISKMRESDNTESFKEIQSQLAALQKELGELKKQAQQQADSSGTKKQPTQEMKQKHEALVNEMSAWEYMEKGNIAAVNRRWEESAEAFSQVIVLNPQIADAYAGKAFALYNLRKTDEAVELVNKALAIQPSSVRSLGVKALLLKDRPDTVDLAMNTINQAIKLRPNMPRSYRIRGEIFIKMDRFNLAQKDFNKACKMGAKDACDRLEALGKKRPLRGER